MNVACDSNIKNEVDETHVV